ncbi:ArnT family glycosyltransferase [Gordonia neofelifaecis]|uniref:Glycosyl transferase family 39 protein n=1 Tax=Gordonia neofelifaecis NRRL B-59395 TaxID=644548 RepID=F1YLG8_9ACTN|nr:glycosyltransferase family 39 protein [Gordonia neofelifaecis]EGD54362.1 glycosyl transferase family 39 protein [Gordonia neofelifaecis NRRL B-59395]
MTATVLDRPQPADPEPDRTDRPARGPLYRGLSLGALLIGTAVLYLWNLSINGWANSFYTAAIQAGSQSWKAWFFGSSDMANSITVDKPPASLWIPGLSVRIFGLNSWSVLVPEVLMGVGSVALLYVITRRYYGHWAAIGAGTVLALTPVAAMMFRFDNPEALLILLMIAACGAVLRAMEPGAGSSASGPMQPGAKSVWWMVAAGSAVGFGFLTKQLEVMLIVPAMALTYLAFGPGRWLRRIGHLFASLAALIVSAGWWVLAVELWPASSRPYIGGSQNNSILELTLGYNGLGRLDGNERGSVGGRGAHEMSGAAAEMFGQGGPGGPGGGGMWGSTGILRMFEPAQGGQIAWLIPSALILAVAAFVLIGKAPRTDLRRAHLSIFGLWMLIMIGTFSFMAGIFHSYYTAAIAPALAAVIAGAAAVCWREREKLWVRIVLAAATWTAAIWGFVLLDRSPDFVPWLRQVMIVVGIVAGVLLLFARSGVLAIVAAGAAIAAGLVGPLAYTIDTVTTAKQGSIISAGPQVEGEFGPGGMGGRHRMNGAFPGMPGGPGAQNGTPGGPGQGFPGMGGPGTSQNGFPGMGGPGKGGSPAGGLLNGSTPSDEMVAVLRADADEYTWVAAAIGSNEASGYQIASGYSVMPIGGFNGTDPSPTLAQFKQYVADGKIHYFIAGGRGDRGGEGFGGPGMGESGTSSEISSWVKANFNTRTVDGVTLYDLTSPKK